jgi:heme-degrading monooxygenase HmoA
MTENHIQDMEFYRDKLKDKEEEYYRLISLWEDEDE